MWRNFSIRMRERQLRGHQISHRKAKRAHYIFWLTLRVTVN
jgi:hypothetical protein